MGNQLQGITFALTQKLHHPELHGSWPQNDSGPLAVVYPCRPASVDWIIHFSLIAALFSEALGLFYTAINKADRVRLDCRILAEGVDI